MNANKPVVQINGNNYTASYDVEGTTIKAQGSTKDHESLVTIKSGTKSIQIPLTKVALTSMASYLTDIANRVADAPAVDGGQDNAG